MTHRQIDSVRGWCATWYVLPWLHQNMSWLLFQQAVLRQNTRSLSTELFGNKLKGLVKWMCICTFLSQEILFKSHLTKQKHAIILWRYLKRIEMCTPNVLVIGFVPSCGILGRVFPLKWNSGSVLLWFHNDRTFHNDSTWRHFFYWPFRRHNLTKHLLAFTDIFFLKIYGILGVYDSFHYSDHCDIKNCQNSKFFATLWGTIISVIRRDHRDMTETTWWVWRVTLNHSCTHTHAHT